ncbi:MAG: GAF domain-containing sensor histidine kinase [Proteobacteria bacterium]|nr:MAG: GAF domain-containing sensor histidine kinase [Pseudomonadota bacterium]
MKVRPSLAELSRRAALDAYQIFHSSDEESFEEIVRSAADFCKTSIASVNFCNGEVVWSKARAGTELLEVEMKDSFCQRVVLSGQSLSVGDVTVDPEFSRNIFVLGEPHVRSYLGVPLKSPDGYVLGTLCIFDTKKRIFGQKHLQHLEFLSRQIMSLMELRKNRSALLAAQKELTSQQQILNESKKQQREFLSNLSHELRTPLNSILGLSEILASEVIDPSKKDLVENLSKSSQNLIETLTTLLEHSKIEAGQIKLNIQPFDLRTFAEGTLAPFKTLAKNQGLDFDVKIDLASEILCHSDPVRIRQVLNNLVSNALKFTAKGKITIEIECNRREKDSTTLSQADHEEGLLSFRISDSGLGIRSEDQRQIFEPYRQFSRDTIHGGSGLGLSICKKIVESMDGQIGFKSKLNQGSNFWFMLPMNVSVGHQLKTSPVHAAHSAAANRLFSGTVLLLEDNSLSSAVTSSFLEKAGLDVRSASNLQESQYLLESLEFDLVLMDLHLGSLLPTTLIREVREKTSAPIITISGSEMSRDRYLEYGIDDAIQKPFSKEALLDKVEAWLLSEKEGNHLIKDWEESLSKLEEQCGADFLNQTIHNFVTRHPADVQKLLRYEADAAWDKLELTAHSMKSTLATLGLMHLARLAGEVEELSGGRDYHLISPILEQFRIDSRKCYQRLIAYVKHQFLSSEKAS